MVHTPWRLSQNQITILDLVAQGYANEHIAERLHVSREAVKSRLKGIYDRMGSDRPNPRVDCAVRWAVWQLEEKARSVKKDRSVRTAVGCEG